MAVIMFTLIVSALSASAAANPVRALGAPVTPKDAAAGVAACGFSSDRAKFDALIQQDVIEVVRVTSASEEQLGCAARASIAYQYYVIFPEALEKAYQPLYAALARESEQANAKAWLAKRGLLARLPIYDPQRYDDRTFSRALERLCGPKATGTLEPGTGMAALNKAASEGRLDEEALWCLVNAGTASGYSIGFVGNEAHRKDQ